MEVVDIGQALGDNVQLLTRNTGLLDGGSKLGLGLVDFGSVEIGVAQLDGGLNAINTILIDLAFVALFKPSGAGPVAELE